MTTQTHTINSIDELMTKYQFSTSPACCFLEIDGVCYGWSSLPNDIDPARVVTVSMEDMDDDSVETVDEPHSVYSLEAGIGSVNVLGYMISETPITDDILIEW